MSTTDARKPDPVTFERLPLGIRREVFKAINRRGNPAYPDHDAEHDMAAEVAHHVALLANWFPAGCEVSTVYIGGDALHKKLRVLAAVLQDGVPHIVPCAYSVSVVTGMAYNDQDGAVIVQDAFTVAQRLGMVLYGSDLALKSHLL